MTTFRGHIPLVAAALVCAIAGGPVQEARAAGAVAMEPGTINFSGVVRQPSRRAAEAAALRGCREHAIGNASRCRIVATFSRQCIGFASVSGRGDAIMARTTTFGINRDMADAAVQAIERCRARAGPALADECVDGWQACDR